MCIVTYMKKLSIYLTVRQYYFLKDKATNMGLTLSDLVRRAVDRYIRRETRGDKR